MVAGVCEWSSQSRNDFIQRCRTVDLKGQSLTAVVLELQSNIHEYYGGPSLPLGRGTHLQDSKKGPGSDNSDNLACSMAMAGRDLFQAEMQRGLRRANSQDCSMQC